MVLLKNHKSCRKAPLAIPFMILYVLALLYAADEWRFSRMGALERRVQRLSYSLNWDHCDDKAKEKRLLLARVIDKNRSNFDQLWSERKHENVQYTALDKLSLTSHKRKIDPRYPVLSDTDSWTSVYGDYLRAQKKFDKDHLRNLDQSVHNLVRFEEARHKRQLNGRFGSKERQFLLNPAIYREGDTLILPLDAGDLEKHKKNLATFVEKNWGMKGNRLKIDWTTGHGIYKIVVDPLLKRAYVSHEEKTIYLESFMDEKELAHEIGHVLGFADHYREEWNSDCSIYYESDGRDLMSSSKRGIITAQHWKLLNEIYSTKMTGPRSQSIQYFF